MPVRQHNSPSSGKTRTRISTALLLVPLFVLLGFLRLYPDVWGAELVVFRFAENSGTALRVPGWVSAGLALAAAVGAAWVGVLGGVERLRMSRRAHRMLAGTAAAVFLLGVVRPWLVADSGVMGSAMTPVEWFFIAVLAAAYGALCAALLPASGDNTRAS